MSSYYEVEVTLVVPKLVGGLLTTMHSVQILVGVEEQVYLGNIE